MEIRRLWAQRGVVAPIKIRRYHPVDRIAECSQPSSPGAKQFIPPDAEMSHDDEVLLIVPRVYGVVDVEVETNMSYIIDSEAVAKQCSVTESSALWDVVENIHSLF